MTVALSLKPQARELVSALQPWQASTDVLDRCELDDRLSKAQLEHENEHLKPLVDRFKEKSNECLTRAGEAAQPLGNYIHCTLSSGVHFLVIWCTLSRSVLEKKHLSLLQNINISNQVSLIFC